MDIKNRIKEAFREEKKITRYSKYDYESQPNLYELDRFLRKSGYRLSEVLDHDGDSIELIIEARDKGYLHPDISHVPAENKFYVNVKKYGELDSGDLSSLIEGYENALGVMRYLENVNLDKLEIHSKD